MVTVGVNPLASGLKGQGARGPTYPGTKGKLGFSVVGTVLARVPGNHDQAGLQASPALGLSRPSIQFNSIQFLVVIPAPRPSYRPALDPISGNLTVMIGS